MTKDLVLPEKCSTATSGAAKSVKTVARVKHHDSGGCAELSVNHISNNGMVLGDFVGTSLDTCRLTLVITRTFTIQISLVLLISQKWNWTRLTSKDNYVV